MRWHFSLFGYRVNLSIRRQERYTAAKLAELAQTSGVIVCMSRCLACARQTPHELCHRCWGEMMQDEAAGVESGPYLDPFAIAEPVGFGQEPETCTDPSCPVWEPDEAEQLRAARQFAEVVG